MKRTMFAFECHIVLHCLLPILSVSLTYGRGSDNAEICDKNTTVGPDKSAMGQQTSPLKAASGQSFRLGIVLTHTAACARVL